MREVVIQSWCDACAADGSDTVGDPIDILWNGKEYSLDLCEDHAVPFRDVDRLITEYGQRIKPARIKKPRPSDADPADDGGHRCEECDRDFSTPQGLGAHRYRTHGYRPRK